MVMESPESWERIDHGLDRAASCCRELARMLDAHEWRGLSRELLLMRKKAKFMYDSAPLSESEVNALVTKMEIAQLVSRYMNGGQ